MLCSFFSLAKKLFYIMQIKPSNVKTIDLHLKKTGLTVLTSFLLFISFDVMAQGGVNDVLPGSQKQQPTTNGGKGKSVYDVIPGSGPKKTTSTAPARKSVYDVIPGSGPKTTGTDRPGGRERGHYEKVYYGKKRHLPPGQAKKIYGGAATDYAPGQLKKREGHEDHHWQGRDDDGKKDQHRKKQGKHKDH